MNRVTKGQVLGGAYSVRDAQIVRRAAMIALAWWTAQTGDGIRMTKSDARFLVESTAPIATAPWFKFFDAGMVDPRALSNVTIGTYAAGNYEAWYLGGYMRYFTGSNGWATAIGGNGIRYSAGASLITKTPQAGLTQSAADSAAFGDLFWPNIQTLKLGTIAHSGGAIDAHFEDPNYADNKWPTQYGASASPGTVANTPIYGISSTGYGATSGILRFPEQPTLYSSATDPNYIGPINYDFLWFSYGSFGTSYRTTYRASIYAPTTPIVYYSSADTDLLIYDGVNNIHPSYSAVPYEMELVTVEFDADWVGAGLADPITWSVSGLLRMYQPHVGSYIKIEMLNTVRL